MIPKRYADSTLDTFPKPDEAAAVRSWLDAGAWKDGANLILSGPVGTGKTGLAMAVLNWFLDTKPRAVTEFADVPEMLELLRPPADFDRMQPYLTAHVLVLDDLGTERATDWVRERLYVLVNRRYLDCLPTIITTNHTIKTLSDHVGERVVSRLQHEATVVAIRGKDLRR